MKLFAEFKNNKSPNYDTIELCYSVFHFISGNPRWFCRIWHKTWLDQVAKGKKDFGESYGSNKFEAYRKALKDLGS